MKYFNYVLDTNFPSCFWCMFMLATFSFYTYKNIFLQAEIGFKLPTVNLVSALNNFDIFVAAPSTERFDLYVNLAKTFDAYKTDYLEHYNDYLLLLNAYLVLDESQIGLKYYAYKHYLNKDYKEHDGFVLGSPIIEFNQNFYTSEATSTDREINLVNKHYHIFGVKNNMPKCEKFFNSYIYPLYKSQSSWKEVEIATSMSKVLKHWTLTNSLQIGIFFCSLIMNFVAVLVLLINRINSKILLKFSYAVTFLLLFSLIYMTLLIMILISLFVKIITYKANMNFEGLHNLGFIVLQMAGILCIGYLAICWIVKFKSLKITEHQMSEKDDSLQAHLTALFDTQPIKEISNKQYHFSADAMNGVLSPFIQKVKRIITPIASQVVSIPNENNNSLSESSVKTAISVEPKTSLVDTIDTQKLFSKDPFDGLKALNLVSAISVSHPNVSPYSEIDKNEDNTSADYSSEKMKETDNLWSAATMQRSKFGSISQSLERKRNGFYQHCGTTAQLRYEISPSVDSKNMLTSETVTYQKSVPNCETSPKEQRLYPFDEKVHSNNNFEWETKFGLKSSQSVSNSLKRKEKKGNSAENKQLEENHTEKQNTAEKKYIQRPSLPQPKKSYQYFIPSTTITSGSTVDTDISNQETYNSKSEDSSNLNDDLSASRRHRKSI